MYYIDMGGESRKLMPDMDDLTSLMPDALQPLLG